MANTAISTAELAEVLEEELLESLWIEDVFGEEAVEQLADDWCRSQHTPDELVERQRLAGGALAEVVQFPVFAREFRPPVGCRAA